MQIAAVSASLSPYAALNGSGGRARGAAQANEVDPEEQRQISALAARDREVRQHEQAHLSAAGGLATSGANYSYQRGPDGRNYAIGGEVSIDVSPGSTPEETLAKAERIRAAALAPADPSGQDRAVAAQAAAMAQEARAELARAGNENPTDGPVDRSADLNRAYGSGGEKTAGRLLEAYA